MGLLKIFYLPSLHTQEPQEKPTRPTGDSDADIIRDTLIRRAANTLYYNNPRSKDNFWSICEHKTNEELIQIIRDFRD